MFFIGPWLNQNIGGAILAWEEFALRSLKGTSVTTVVVEQILKYSGGEETEQYEATGEK